MDPTSETPPPVATARWRKVVWCLLVAVVIGPTFWAGSAIAGFALASCFRRIDSGFWEVTIPLVLAPLVAFAAIFVVARRGLRRGKPNGKGTLWVWSLMATGMLTLVAVILVAVMRVRQSSNEKCVLCNVRQLSAAADQYFLEYGGSTVAYSNLIGATNYVKALNTVDHETYPAFYTQGITITVTGIGGLRTVTYAP